MEKLTIPSKTELTTWAKRRYTGDIGQIYRMHDKILADIFSEEYRANKSVGTVTVKVALLNMFYSTRIINTALIANGIHANACKIDKALAKGDLTAVDMVRHVDKNRDNYSFATKYCYFSNPDKFSIYDKYVALLLTEYVYQNKWYEHESVCHLYPNPRHKVSRTRIMSDMKTYHIFMKYIDIFMDKCNCHDRWLIDNFLWLKGKDLYAQRKQ